MAEEAPIYQPPEGQLAGGEMTLDYMAMPWTLSIPQYATRPWFTLLQMRTMLLDQQVWFGLQLRNAPLIHAKVKVHSSNSDVQKFVQNEWDKFWQRFAPKILATKYYGYSGFEVVYERNRDGHWTIDNLKDFAPTDVRPMRQSKGPVAGRIAGVAVHGHRQSFTGEASQSPTRLFGMKGLWLDYNAQFGSPFGEAATYHCYPAWWDKAMPGGAYDLRRLRGKKDAWIGDVVKFPGTKKFVRPDGSEVSGKDIARELVELRESGGVMWMYSDRDANSNPLFEYQPPQEVADTGVIRNWIEAADWDIFDGLLVPKEVVEAASSGSGFSGRSIPFVMFMSVGDEELLQYVLAWKKQIGESLVERNFSGKSRGSTHRDIRELGLDFEMEPVPLLDTMADKMGGQAMGGPVGGSTGAGQNGFHQGPPDGRPLRAASFVPTGNVPEQFAVADEPAEVRRQRRTIRGIETRGGAIARRLERLLKKN